MRIDGPSSASLPLARSTRTGGAVTPYRGGQAELEAHRQPLAPLSGHQGVEQGYPVVQASAEEGDGPLGARDLLTLQRPVGSHVAKALTSYAVTASLSIDAEAENVLSLDLYA